MLRRRRKSLVSELNAARVLREVRFGHGVSRMELASRLGLHRSAVTNIVADLIDRGVLQEGEVGTSSPQGGRRPIALRINCGYASVLGVELQPDAYTAVGIRLDGDVLFAKTERMPIRGCDAREAFLEVVRLVRPELDRAAMPVAGIGVAMPGIVNPRDGVLVRSRQLGVEGDVDFYGHLRGKLDVPVVIDNDANACAWGEVAFHGSGRLGNSLFVLVEFRPRAETPAGRSGIATGIGIVIDGKVYRGETFAAGVFRGIQEPDQAHLGLTWEETFRIEQDEVLLARYLRGLARHIAFLVNVLDLRNLFFGGSIERYGPRLTAVVQEEIQASFVYERPVKCSIRYSSFGERAVAHGAAGMVVEHLFSLPEIADDADAEWSPWASRLLRLGEVAVL